MGFVSEAQKEALFRNRDLYNAKRKTGEIVQRRERTTKRQLDNQMKQVEKVRKRRSFASEINQKKVIKAVLSGKSTEEAAKEIGISESQASRLIANAEKSGSLAEALFKAGLTFERQAELHNEFINYNKEKVVRVTGEGMNSREVEEMRDGRLAFTAAQHAAKFTAVSADVLANKSDASNIDDNTALLAIKSLIQKLNTEQLKIIIESCEALIDKGLKIIE